MLKGKLKKDPGTTKKETSAIVLMLWLMNLLFYPKWTQKKSQSTPILKKTTEKSIQDLKILKVKPTTSSLFND